MFTAFMILLRNFVRSPESYRRQFAWPLVGFVPPMTANIVTALLLPSPADAEARERLELLRVLGLEDFPTATMDDTVR